MRQPPQRRVSQRSNGNHRCPLLSCRFCAQDNLFFTAAVRDSDLYIAFFQRLGNGGLYVRVGFAGHAIANFHQFERQIAPHQRRSAQARYLERYQVLAKAVGLLPSDDAWHTE